MIGGVADGTSAAEAAGFMAAIARCRPLGDALRLLHDERSSIDKLANVPALGGAWLTRL